MVPSAVATDLHYIAKKSIIVARPGRPGETVDLVKIAVGFRIPRNVDITKKWSKLARYIVVQVLYSAKQITSLKQKYISPFRVLICA